MKALLLLLAAITHSATLPDEREDQVKERGRACTQRFFEGELDLLWEEFDDKLRAGLGSLEQLDGFRQQALAQLGNEKAITNETVTALGNGWSYVRIASFEKIPQPIEVIFGFDSADRVSVFLIRPVATEAPTRYLDYQTKSELHLPFEGEWTVFWGGRTLKENYHTAYADQRFAYDFLQYEDGLTHSGDGAENEDYHCFAKPILVPAAGKVVVAVDGVEDNVPGKMNPAQAAGNHVILDHGNGEFSLLAHFKKGSLKAKPGDELAAGQLLGLCGNSGNSSEPHLHYHLQTTSVFGKGDGLPMQFVDYLADGKRVARGEPTKGQRISRP